MSHSPREQIRTHSRQVLILLIGFLILFPWAEAFGKSAIIQRDRTPVLFKPSRDSLKLFRLKQYDVVRILEEKKEWYYIEFDTVDATLKGWIKKIWVTPSQTAASSETGEGDEVPKAIADEFTQLAAPPPENERTWFRWAPFRVQVGPMFSTYTSSVRAAGFTGLDFDRAMQGAWAHVSWLPIPLYERRQFGSLLLGFELEGSLLLIDADVKVTIGNKAAQTSTNRLSGMERRLFPKLSAVWYPNDSVVIRSHIGLFWKALALDDPIPRAPDQVPYFTETNLFVPSFGFSGSYELRHSLFDFIFEGFASAFLPLGLASENPSDVTGESASPGFGFELGGGVLWRAKILWSPLTIGTRLSLEKTSTQFSGVGLRTDATENKVRNATLDETALMLTIPVGLVF